MKIENIKFKAKRLDNGKWVYGYFYEENGNTYIIGNRQKESMLNRNVTYEVDPSTICQFTGMKDNYGGEIYERDIVKMLNTDGTFTHYSVIWNTKKCTFIFEGFYDRSTELSFCILEHYRVQIIGNKFDKKGGKA